MSTKPAPRRRRSAEESRRRILDAAQKRLTQGGPEAVRLQDVAADVGISHPTVLHHFGSREGLLEALEERALSELAADLLANLSASNVEALLERAEHTFGDEGYARLLAWQVLSGRATANEAGAGLLRRIGDAVQATITAERREQGQEPPDPEAGAFCVRLAATVLFGEAILGETLTRSAELGDPNAARVRFRHWLSRMFQNLPLDPEEPA